MRKDEKMLRSLELIDDKYIEEADPTKVKRKKKNTMLLRLAVGFAACFTVLLTSINLWLFIPFSTEPPDVSRYSDSEYYPLIRQLNALTYRKPDYKNNFEKLIGSISQNIDDSGEGFYGVESMQPNAPGNQYEEVTDNQVEGVIEGDLIKRSDKYIYYLNVDNGSLNVYTIEGENSSKVSAYTITIKDAFSKNIHDWEFYLSNDCTTVTVIAPYSAVTNDTWEPTTRTQVVSLDVSDPTNIRKTDSIDIAGNYTSSRMVDGKLLLLNEYYIGYHLNFDYESTFLPQIDIGNGFESIPMDDIITPETLTTPRYTVVCKLDEKTLELEDASAFLSYSETIYVSNENVYATRSYSDITKENDGYKTTVSMTEISALSYTGDQFEQLGGITVKGSVKDQYSLDEYEGILRVVTTTSLTRTKEWSDGEIASITVDRSSNGTSASLYCIDLDSWEVVAAVADFAPKGESVQSVRFDGDSAYVCTAVVVTLTDPVFFFDLSDLDNITYKDTGVIKGYSSSLINLGDGFLLGVGVGDDPSTLKLEVYEESEKGVVSVSAYEIENAQYSTDYKSYLVDREHRLFGLGVTDWSFETDGYYNETDAYYNPYRYMLFYFDNYELRVLVDEALNFDNAYKRAVYIDDYLYMFANGEDNVKVVKVGLTDGE